MKKSIGAKVFTWLIIMGIIMAAVIAINIYSLKEIQKDNEKMSGYLSTEQVKGDLSTAFQQAQLYANLCYFKQGTEEIDTMREKLGAAIETMNADAATLSETANALAKTESDVSEVMITWMEGVQSFSDYCQGILDLANEEKFDDVMTQVNGIKEAKTAAQDAETAYNELLVEKQAQLEKASAGQISKSIKLDLILLVIYIIIFIIAIVIVQKRVAKPAKESGRMIEDIVQKLQNNEGDLTERLPVKYQDEIGQMSNGINGFIEQLQGIMLTLKEDAENLSAAAESVANEVGESNENASNVSATMEEMSASIEEISATLGQIAEGSDNVLADVNNMSENVSNGVGLVNEIKGRAASMRAETIEGKEGTSESMNEMRDTLTGAVEESRSVEQINELTGEILNIASQTNLLALNASIEAARAGEAGKGFAVVADEISKLAANSAETANNIQDISNMVTGAVQRLADKAEEMLSFIDEKVMEDYDKFVEVVDQYRDDAESVNEIMEEFERNTQTITETMESMNIGLNDVSVAIGENAQGVTLVAQSTVELVQAMENIKDESNTNQEISSQLNDEVGKFKNL
ncbi:methyl-accepting chemotaxis protein [Eubacterium oxidoreducens]|uniref:Methyl-accepting chemotaxis protein n=1 Tax=Eubacterium oxidoreducens TaxID=1732 RepID=A0A1G6AWP5_EUBOX|nr:methyl-accepting chemotaxis protein [Eubacterium oxidoreducens]SDB12663.1 methyl-accepting chemotaxis protein [Eubacterium oxidoreducens]